MMRVIDHWPEWAFILFVNVVPLAVTALSGPSHFGSFLLRLIGGMAVGALVWLMALLCASVYEDRKTNDPGL